ncbi:MAG: hypothetical protein WKG00_31350 [Polyangiaceae bacterium]
MTGEIVGVDRLRVPRQVAARGVQRRGALADLARHEALVVDGADADGQIGGALVQVDVACAAHDLQRDARRQGDARGERAAETHFAIAVDRSAAEVVAIAEQAGWRARICNRGGLFDLVEVWVEGAYPVEVLDPAQMADYRRSMTVEGWQKAFGLA